MSHSDSLPLESVYCNGRTFGLSARGTGFETSNFQFLIFLYISLVSAPKYVFGVFALGAPFEVFFYVVPGRVRL